MSLEQDKNIFSNLSSLGNHFNPFLQIYGIALKSINVSLQKKIFANSL